MAVRAVVFDIGGVLELTPSLGVTEKWEELLGLQPGDLNARLRDVWAPGSLGQITEEQVHEQIGERLGLGAGVVEDFMADTWREYLGTPNTELIGFFRGLRPQYLTGIVSNSFVGARHREQEAYGFEDYTDTIVYSHEVGVAKPDPRIYEMATHRLDVRPAEVVFLDDREVCVEGARAVGMQAIQFIDTGQAIADIRALL